MIPENTTPSTKVRGPYRSHQSEIARKAAAEARIATSLGYTYDAWMALPYQQRADMKFAEQSRRGKIGRITRRKNAEAKAAQSTAITAPIVPEPPVFATACPARPSVFSDRMVKLGEGDIVVPRRTLTLIEQALDSIRAILEGGQ